MKGKDVVNWANEKIAQIRQYTTDPSLLDPILGDKKAPSMLKVYKVKMLE